MNQGPRWDCFMEKTRGQKSRDTVPSKRQTLSDNIKGSSYKLNISADSSYSKLIWLLKKGKLGGSVCQKTKDKNPVALFKKAYQFELFISP
jgi:hypothetical protein